MIVDTFTAQIYVGLKHTSTNVTYSINMAKDLLQREANKGGLCVTLTPTEFIYRDGNEPGFVVGLINYPRFPETPSEIKDKAMVLAKTLKDLYGQQRVSVVFPDETVMLS